MALDAHEYHQTTPEKCVNTNESHLVGKLCVGDRIALKSQGELSRKWCSLVCECVHYTVHTVHGLICHTESHSNLHLVLEQIALYPIKSCGPCKVRT